MGKIEDLELAFRKTFEDKFLSKAEKKALRQLLAESGLDQRKRDILRSKIFQIAREGLMKGEAAFALEWVEDASRLLEEKVADQGNGSSVYFSPGEDCVNAIISRIQSAGKKLDICVFTISDDRIADAILGRHARGVDVRIITDNDKLYDTGSDIEKLAGKGVPIRIDKTNYHMHHKFALFDNNSVITGSYNWTRSAADYNEENILVTEEPIVVSRYAKAFEDLWKGTDPFS